VTYSTRFSGNMTVQGRIITGGSVAAVWLTDEGTSNGSGMSGFSMATQAYSTSTGAVTFDFAVQHNSGGTQSIQSECSVLRIG
jgi:hypothetical protein